MIRKILAISFLLLANTVLLAHSVVPHHHHCHGVCLEDTHCHSEEDHHKDNCSDSEEHHHDSNDLDEDFCSLKQLTPTPVSFYSFNHHSIGQKSTKTPFLFYTLFTYNILNLEQQDSSPPDYTSYLPLHYSHHPSQTQSLRAPPLS